MKRWLRLILMGALILPISGAAQKRDAKLRKELKTVENKFREGRIPGWKTDRGRIYMKYGPPDEIESHPRGERYRRPLEQGGGETVAYPFETWRYRYIEGFGTNAIFEFVDRTMTGKYRMVVDPSMQAALQADGK